jgi:hypothetical protein
LACEWLTKFVSHTVCVVTFVAAVVSAANDLLLFVYWRKRHVVPYHRPVASHRGPSGGSCSNRDAWSSDTLVKRIFGSERHADKRFDTGNQPSARGDYCDGCDIVGWCWCRCWRIIGGCWRVRWWWWWYVQPNVMAAGIIDGRVWQLELSE